MNDDPTVAALLAAATAARDAVLEFSFLQERREDYLPLEELAQRVQRRVVEAGFAAWRERESPAA
jgi:hypothetical protein